MSYTELSTSHYMIGCFPCLAYGLSYIPYVWKIIQIIGLN